LIVEIVSGIGVLAGAVSAFIVWVKKLVEGQKCQLRSEMLRTYYNNKDNGKIRQYEIENFLLLYKAYKSLKGNSFIDKIHNEVIEWEVET
jgi:hypothetical protein